MKAQVQELEANKVALTVEVAREKVQQAYSSFFQRASHSVNIPGFRRGKVPRAVLINHIGAENIREQIEEELVQEVYPEVVRENKLRPVSTAKIEESNLKEGEPFTFKAIIEVRPTLPEFNYQGRSVTVKRAIVDDSAIDKVLQNLAEQFSKTLPVEDGELTIGDYFLASIDVSCEGTKDEELSEARAYRKLTAEAEMLRPAIGMKPGETRSFQHVITTDAQKDHKYFGKTLDYTVKLDRISRPQAPAITDEFAKEVGDFKTLDELKAKIRDDLNERTKHDAEERAVDAILRQMSDEVPFSVPESMIQHTVDFFLKDIDRRWRQYGASLTDYLKKSNKDIKEYRESFREKATLQTRIMLLIDAIAERENVTVSDADYRAEVEKRAEQYQYPVEKLMETLAQSDGESNIRHSLVSEKIHQFLLKNSTVQYDMVNEAELKEGDHGDSRTHSH